MSLESNTQRYCKSCDTTKELDKFPKNKNKHLGYGHTCKDCSKKYFDKYKKTENGVIRELYYSHKHNSKKRHNAEVDYDIEWLKQFMYDNNFKEMFNTWKESGYDKWYKPSIDRIDDYGTYTKDNIQLLTFSENWEKSIYDKVVGNTNKQNKAVVGYYPNGEVVEFHSVSEASRVTKANVKNIIYCCNKKPRYKTSKGIRWEWK